MKHTFELTDVLQFLEQKFLGPGLKRSSFVIIKGPIYIDIYSNPLKLDYTIQIQLALSREIQEIRPKEAELQMSKCLVG